MTLTLTFEMLVKLVPIAFWLGACLGAIMGMCGTVFILLMASGKK
jgi:hypothetical protein